MEKQTNEKAQKGFFSKISKRLTSLTMQKAVLAVAIIFVLAVIVTAGNVIIKNGQITAADNLTVDTNTLFVDATNNRVGIGTTSPINELDVGSNYRAETTQIGINARSDKQVALVFYSNGTFKSGIYRPGNSNDIRITTTGTADVITVNQNGSVGIGTTSPSVPLEIGNNSDSALGDLRINVGTSSGTRGITIARRGGLAGYQSNIYQSGVAPTLIIENRMTGTDDYGAIHNVIGNSESASSVFKIQEHDGTVLVTAKGGTGNVGIGTITPSQKLHVQGNLNVTGDIWGEGILLTTSPAMLESADGGKTIIGVKADDGKWVGCAVYNVNGNYEFKCAPNEEVDAKLAKIEARRVCDAQNKLFNAETHECYDEPVQNLG